MNTTPRIFLTCLACYNAGRLVGAWIDGVLADVSAESVLAGTHPKMREHSCENPEELFITDYEGFGPVSIGEYEDLETVQQIAELIEEHGEVFGAYIANRGLRYCFGWDEVAEDFQESYQGTWGSKVAFAEYLADEVFFPLIPDHITTEVRRYFDAGTYTRDIFMGDYWSTYVADGVAVFRQDI